MGRMTTHQGGASGQGPSVKAPSWGVVTEFTHAVLFNRTLGEKS